MRFIRIAFGPLGLRRIICNVLRGKDVGADEFDDIGKVHIADLVASFMIVFFYLIIPAFYTQAVGWRGDAHFGQGIVVAAGKKFEEEGLGQDHQPIFLAGHLNEGIGAGAAQTKKTYCVCGVIPGIVHIQIKNGVIQRDQRMLCISGSWFWATEGKHAVRSRGSRKGSFIG